MFRRAARTLAGTLRTALQMEAERMASDGIADGEQTDQHAPRLACWA